ncbi:MAG: glycine betaine ABC transporter substrate-binding protein [Methylocystaceae bacterium]
MRIRWIDMILLAALVLVVNAPLSGCLNRVSSNRDIKVMIPSTSIVFADAEWESIKMHSRIAGYIIEHGYGYTPRYLTGENLPLFKALNQGDVDIMMEVWTLDYPVLWKQLLKDGKVKALATNYIGTQGWYIPAYLAEGDKERGIEPQIPNIKSVFDLPAYQKYFKLSASSSMGIIYNAPRGWPAEETNKKKFNNYFLFTSFTLLPGDSEAALAASLDKAYARGNAWLGYARDPSMVTAGHKMLMLREEPYNEEIWNADRMCAYPDCDVVIAANSGMNKKAPEVLDFLQNYQTTRNQNEEILLCLNKANGNREQAAREWLLKNPDVWGQWVPEAIAKKVWADLNPAPVNKKPGLSQRLLKLFKIK